MQMWAAHIQKDATLKGKMKIIRNSYDYLLPSLLHM